jgi:hypothetical protein
VIEMFSKDEIGTLCLTNDAFLKDAIVFLARHGNLRSKEHKERMDAAAKVFRKGLVLSSDEKKYFVRQTPYDKCVFISLYWRQINNMHSIDRYSAPKSLKHVTENREQRHARQGGSSGKGIRLYAAARKLNKETIDGLTIPKANRILNLD